MAGLTNKLIEMRAWTQSERERRVTYVEVLRHLPAGGVVDDLRADGSRTLIYIHIPMAGPESE